jgi:geranylgeranyl pyrophosphate synthase
MEPDLKQILQPLDRDLERVSARLVASLQHPVARQAVYLITAGGKRLRPALVLLAGRSGKHAAHREALLELATAVELIHTATLIHDDIIDGSILRRWQPTFHARFGTERAVLMGDYLYALAFSILAQLRQPYVTRFMAGVCQQMSRGEFLEVDSRYDLRVSEDDYLQIVRDKTASLVAACCHLGAYLAGAKAETVDRLSEFGWNFGMAFQIMDDCLDLIGNERRVGKTLQSDLDKGAFSLPVIYLAGSLTAQQRQRMFAPLRRRAVNRLFLSRIARAAHRSGAIERALRTAETFIQNAAEAVAGRDGVVLAGTYQALARYAVERTQ